MTEKCTKIDYFLDSGKNGLFNKKQEVKYADECRRYCRRYSKDLSAKFDLDHENADAADATPTLLQKDLSAHKFMGQKKK